MRDVAKQEVATGSNRKDRCILNVSSTTGTHGNAGQVSHHSVQTSLCHALAAPHGSRGASSLQANYATAKAGVLGLTKTVGSGATLQLSCLHSTAWRLQLYD